MSVRFLACALVAALSAGCSPAGLSSSAAHGAGILPSLHHACTSGLSGCTPIQHVVIIMQENRSFDNVFAGFPNANSATSGPMSNGQIVNLRPVNFNTADLDHGYGGSIRDYNLGKMNQFDQGYTSNGYPAGALAYGYLSHPLVKPYWIMARRFTLADAMFPTEHGASWTAHLDIIGTTNISASTAVVDFPSSAPWDCEAGPGTTTPTIDTAGNYNNYGPRPCFTQFDTMAHTLDERGISWRFYAPAIDGDIGGLWSPFGAIKAVREGPDWSNIVNPPATFITDVQAGNLPAVTWVTPEWNYSDHAGGGATLGPSWVSALVNTIGQSRYWKSTAIVILWDDWGGWYDNAVPPQLDFKGLGIRVPCIIISPYARLHYVSHTQYEFGSVLRFVEDTFGLRRLGSAADGYSDARASSIVDSFDFTQKPTPFRAIPAPVPASYFIGQPESGKVPDDE